MYHKTYDGQGEAAWKYVFQNSQPGTGGSKEGPIVVGVGQGCERFLGGSEI